MKRFYNLIEYSILVIALIPGFYLSYYVFQSPWTLFRLARAIISIPENIIATYTSSAAAYRLEHLGEIFLNVAMLLFSQWPAEWIAQLPLGTLLSVVVYYAITLKISKSRLLASMMAIFVGWYYPRLVSQFGIQTYVWTNSLFLVFLMVFWDWISERRAVYSLLIILFFIITFLFYQTTPIWMILALLSALLLNSINNKSNLLKKRNVSWALPLFCIVFYLAFDTVIYGNFLARLTSEAVSENLIINITSKVIAPLFQSKDISLPPYHTVEANSSVATTSTLITWILFVLPVAYWVLMKFLRAWREHNWRLLLNKEEDIFIWSIIFVAAGHAIGYSSYGSISLRVIPLTFPLLLIIIPQNLGLPKSKLITNALIFSLVIVTMAGFLGYTTTFKSDMDVSQIGYAADLLEDEARVLSDAGVYGAFNLKKASRDNTVELVWPSSENYEALVKGENINDLRIDYTVISKNSKPLVTISWIFLEPWTNHMTEIEDNRYLNKIYDSKYFSVFQPTDVSIPIEKDTYASSIETRSNYLQSFFQLFGMLTILLGLPGSLTILILLTFKLIKIDNFYYFMSASLIVSIGLVTAFGYGINFTGLGLRSYVIVITIYLVMLIAGLLWARTKNKERFSDHLFGIGNLTALLITWTIISSFIAVTRNVNNSRFTELFITQPQSSQSSIIVHVVNRESIDKTYTLLLSPDGESSRVIDTISLNSNSYYQKTITNIPDDANFSIILSSEEEDLNVGLHK